MTSPDLLTYHHTQKGPWFLLLSLLAAALLTAGWFMPVPALSITFVATGLFMYLLGVSLGLKRTTTSITLNVRSQENRCRFWRTTFEV